MSNSPRNMLRKQVVKMKVCVVGDPLAGKSTLINLLLQEQEEEPDPTEEYEVTIYLLDTKAALMQIQLWDCSNHHFEYHKHLRHAYFRNSSAALLVFDITRQDWQQTAHNWISQAYDNQCYLVYAIATKIEKIKQKQVVQELKDTAVSLFKKYEIIVHFLNPQESIQKHFEVLFGRMHDQSMIVSRGSVARGMQLPFLVEEEESLPNKTEHMQ